MNPEQIARKRFMMFSCSNISREEHIKSRHESKNQKVFKSDFKVVLYSTAKIIYIVQLRSIIIIPIVNPEMFTIARFFWIEMHSHRLLEYFFSFVGIQKNWANVFIS